MVEYIKGRRRRLKVDYIVYFVWFPNAQFYIGYTSKHFFRRWRGHIARNSNSGMKECLKQYGVEGARAIVLKRFSTAEQALAYEKEAIANFRPPLNRSKGGEGGSRKKRR